MQKVTSMALYYSRESCHFATVGTVKCDCSLDKWFVSIGAKDTEEVRWTKRVVFAEKFEYVRDWLAERHFYPLNKMLILIPEEQKEEVEGNTYFLDQLSKVFGPDAFSLVYYARNYYRFHELYDLDIPWEQHHWYWYGNQCDPAIDTILRCQVMNEIADMDDSIRKDYYENRKYEVGRFAEIDNVMYWIRDWGEVDEF
jgi:hypothetical protein